MLARGFFAVNTAFMIFQGAHMKMSSTIGQFTEVTSSSSLRKVVAAATIGTALEWFDLVVYGFFAVVIAKLFFPSENEVASLIAALSTFGVSYLMRPVGALILGAYSDRYGRKKGLTLSIALMAIGTMMITLTPSYASIGFAAPVIVVLGRLVQGVSAGGEFGTSTSFLVEHSPVAKRGFYASFQMAAQGATAVIAALFGTLLTKYLTPEQLLGWGWRIPFAFGLLIIPVASYIRHHVDETPVFQISQHTTRPVRETFTNNKVRLLLAIGIYALVTTASYVIVLYLPTFAIKQLKLDPSLAFAGSLLMGALLLVGAPLAGALADRFGRKKVLFVFAIYLVALQFPLFRWLLSNPNPSVFLTMCFFFGIGIAGYQGPMPAVLSELFPSRIRTTGLALTHNLAVATFGGFAPLILTWGIHVTHSNLVPAAYVTVAGIVSMVCMLVCMWEFGDHVVTE